MKFKYTLLSALLIFSITACKTATQKEWKTDVTQIVQDTAKSKKNGFIVFTVSDSDNRSRQLLKHVFNENFFLSASSRFVLYNVDIVRDESLMPTKILKQNYLSLSKYNVLEMPHLCVMNSDGDVYYSNLIPENIKTTTDFLEYLNEIHSKGKEVDKIKKEIKSTAGTDKIKAIDNFFNKIYLLGSDKYNTLFDEGIKSDPQNKTGLTGKFILAQKQIIVEKLLAEKKYESAINEFKTVLKTKMLTDEEEQALWCNMAYFATAIRNPSKKTVIEYLEKALNSAPNSKRAKDIKSDIEYLKNKEPEKE